MRPGGESSPFGRELRRLRERRGLSLRQFAELASYSRGYIGKVENGDKPPTSELAHRCDQVLEAGGTLIALATAEAVPRLAQLPAAAATFVGRQEQLAQALRALTDQTGPGTPPTVAVDGPPGVGKTALALRLAHQVKDRFPDGQLYVNLHGYSRDEQPARPYVVLEEFLVALGVRACDIPARIEQRAALYRSLLDGRRVLLVLDNARDSEQVGLLLPGSVRCGVVLTSRRRLSGLDMRQDQRLTLGPMTERESMTLLRAVVGGSRADEEPQAIAVLARRCGHLPLALRIAAERVATHPHHSVDELVEELGAEEERLDALVTEDSVAVRSVFSWSYRDLGAEAARLFRLLGLHRGPHLSATAAAALAGVSTVRARRLLDRLVGVHLVEGIGGDRYRVHDLLRVYAAERALAEEPEAERMLAVRRVLAWYVHTVYAANNVLSPQRHDPPLDTPEFSLPLVEFASYDQALSWCENEMQNLEAATELAVEVGDNDTAWKIPAGSWNYLFLRKRWGSWVRAHEIGLIGAQRSGDRFGEAWVRNNLAHAYRELRRLDEAWVNLEQALATRREIGDRIGEAWTLTAMGFVDCDLRRFEDAAQRFRRVLVLRGDIRRRHRDDAAILVANRHGEGIALASLGDVFRELRRHDEALDHLHQALAIFREIDDRHGEAYTLIKLANTFADMCRVQDAFDTFARVLVVRRQIGDRWGEAEALENWGRVLSTSGQAAAARDCWRQALEIFDELGDPRADDVRALLDQSGPDRVADAGS